MTLFMKLMQGATGRTIRETEETTRKEILSTHTPDSIKQAKQYMYDMWAEMVESGALAYLPDWMNDEDENIT